MGRATGVEMSIVYRAQPSVIALATSVGGGSCPRSTGRLASYCLPKRCAHTPRRSLPFGQTRVPFKRNRRLRSPEDRAFCSTPTPVLPEPARTRTCAFTQELRSAQLGKGEYVSSRKFSQHQNKLLTPLAAPLILFQPLRALHHARVSAFRLKARRRRWPSAPYGLYRTVRRRRTR